MLVVLEGIDGVGKSTIAQAVRKTFVLNDVVLCSDPCKEHPATLALRQYVLARGTTLPISTQVEIFKAARLILWHDIIQPALDGKALVICDRLWLSTWVYQGVEVEPIPKIDLLIYLYDKPEAISDRMVKRGLENGWDIPDVAHLSALDAKYRAAITKATLEKNAIHEAVQVNASSIEKATAEIVKLITERKSGLRIFDTPFAYLAPTT